jgi:exopolysaccharide production protein ExoY
MTFGSDNVCDFPISEAANDSLAQTSVRLQSRIDWRSRDMWNGPSALMSRPWLDESRLMRALDVVGAALILVITCPFLILLAIILQIDNPGPLFYVHRRIGRGGRLFTCIKFRTMCTDAEGVLKHILETSSEARAEWLRDHKLRSDPRITRLGTIVRKLSLDEFPQLINILRGDMSLVGPRPIVESEIVRYGRYFEEYCRVRPGLTGLWQVSGRNDVTYRRRVSIDCYYVRNKSLIFNMAILLRTIPVVLGARGSY